MLNNLFSMHPFSTPLKTSIKLTACGKRKLCKRAYDFRKESDHRSTKIPQIEYRVDVTNVNLEHHLLFNLVFPL